MLGYHFNHTNSHSLQIYPAALRAQKRRKAAIERKEEDDKRKTYRDQKYKTVFMEKMSRETSSWLSEYQRSFPAYNSTVYSQSLSSRANYDVYRYQVDDWLLCTSISLIRGWIPLQFNTLHWYRSPYFDKVTHMMSRHDVKTA